MKKLIAVVLCLSFQGIFAQEAEVRKAIEIFFDGLHTQDTLKMKSVFAKEMLLHSVAEMKSGNVLSVETVPELCQSIASIPKTMKIEEKLLSWNIQIDGGMAHVRIPYEFYIDGKMSHSGVNSFQLFKDNGVWKITYCMDTRRRP